MLKLDLEALDVRPVLPFSDLILMMQVFDLSLLLILLFFNLTTQSRVLDVPPLETRIGELFGIAKVAVLI